MDECRHAQSDGREIENFGEELIGRTGECHKEDSENGEEVDDILDRMRQSGTKNGDVTVVPEEMQKSALREKGDKSDADKVDVVKSDDRLEVDEFTCLGETRTHLIKLRCCYRRELKGNLNAK